MDVKIIQRYFKLEYIRFLIESTFLIKKIHYGLAI